MLFDFETFSNIAKLVYRNVKVPYSEEDVLSVFACYFATYEHHMRRPHPPINARQIRRIIQEMPYIDPGSKGGKYEDIIPEAYVEELIPKHFQTKYRHCDYNINHFFSGSIRQLRYYETLY